MFLRTLIPVRIALLAGVCITHIVSVNLDTAGAGFIDTQSEANPSVIRYVKNSEICETTPNVAQISGYIDVGMNMSMVCFCAPCSRCRLNQKAVVLVL